MGEFYSLKRCPKCGCFGKMIIEKQHGFYYVECMNIHKECELKPKTDTYDSYNSAIDAWNMQNYSS